MSQGNGVTQTVSHSKHIFTMGNETHHSTWPLVVTLQAKLDSSLLISLHAVTWNITGKADSSHGQLAQKFYFGVNGCIGTELEA